MHCAAGRHSQRCWLRSRRLPLGRSQFPFGARGAEHEGCQKAEALQDARRLRSRGSKLAKLSLLEQSAALDLADWIGFETDEVDEACGGGLGSTWDPERDRAAAASDRTSCSPWAQAANELRGHGSERLAQLEDLLSHEEWEPINGRVAFWRELRLLLEANPLLHSHLVPPTSVEQIAAYLGSAAMRSVRLVGRWRIRLRIR